MKKSVFSVVAEFLAGIVLITFASCGNDDNSGPFPVITGISRTNGVIESDVTIYGDQFIPTVPTDKGVGPYPNTSIVAFNGTVAEAEYVYQDSIGKQRIITKVPAGATSGKITITANGNAVSSTEEFSITIPVYLPNVEVTTVPGWGLDIAINNDGSLFLTHNYPYEIIKMTQDGQVQTLWSSSQSDIPYGISVDSKGNVFATVVGSYILKIGADGKVTNLAGSAEGGDVDGQGASARFKIPLGIAVDKEGNVFVADLMNYKIRKITPDGTVSTLAGSTIGFKDGIGINAQFENPIDVALDADGNVYVADGHRIRKVTSDGQVSTVAGSAPGYKDGSVANAQFNSINGIVIDTSGNIYLCDLGNLVVRRIAQDGTVVTVAGRGTFGYLDGPGPSALFTQTLGLTIDSSGDIYLTQGGGLYKIRKIIIN